MTTSGAASSRENVLAASPAGSKALHSATAALVAVNVLVFLAMSASAHHILKFDGGLVLEWGGNYGPLTMGGQWWRLISAMFVHIGLAHLLINMWCLYELGLMTESILGRPSMFLVYGLTGVAGGLASLARNPTIISAGASGAIFGLAGVLIATLLLGKLPVPRRDLWIALASLAAFSAYNLTYGFLKGGIDNGAHVGGLVSGLLIGMALSLGATLRQRLRWREGLVYGLVLVLLMMGYAAVKNARGEIVELEAARQALAQGDSDSAIRRLSGLRDSADNSVVQSLLATAYAQKKQYAQAERCYRRALQLDPRNFAARSGLGAILIETGRLPEAVKELQKAARLNPGSGGIWLQLGIVLQKLGRHVEAISALQNAVALDSRSVQAEFALGISEMNLRQYDAAISAFQKTTQLLPDNYEAQIWLANAYQAGGRANEAAVAYLRAAQLRRRAMARPNPAGRR
jgi:membrane associated rhomboid family serine protease/Flp pilus assembly protein TadD